MSNKLATNETYIQAMAKHLRTGDEAALLRFAAALPLARLIKH